MNQKLTLALVSLDIQWHNPQKNYELAETYIAQARQQHADGVVLPEMFATGFSMDTAKVSEEPEGETWQFLQRMAKQYQIGIAGGFTRKISGDLQKETKSLQNVMTFFKPDGTEAGTVIKVHPFTYAGESEVFIGADQPTVLDWLGWKIGGLICYDLRFPEAFRLIANQVDCFIIPANWPSARIEHWHTLLKARAIENQCYAVGVNRTGMDGNGLEYPLSSIAHDPTGRTVTSTKTDEQLMLIELDRKQVTETRQRAPFLKDQKLI